MDVHASGSLRSDDTFSRLLYRLRCPLHVRPNLILVGPADSGKRPLMRSLALSLVEGDRQRLCLVQGHPWWAAATNRVGFYTERQIQHSLWRFTHFVEQATRSERVAGLHVVCIERMSVAEVEVYFARFSTWLTQVGLQAMPQPFIRLLGTVDVHVPLEMDPAVLSHTALFHVRDGVTDGHLPVSKEGDHYGIGG